MKLFIAMMICRLAKLTQAFLTSVLQKTRLM